MNASYSIPETAKLTGIPEHAIREYARQFADVLPVPETNEGGRATVKRYPDAALAIFRSIRKLKDEGLDTAQIRTALQGPGGTDGYGDWDNIALQTAAEGAPDGEPESVTEWQEAGTEGEAETAPVEATHEEHHQTTTEEWTASETVTTSQGDAAYTESTTEEWTATCVVVVEETIDEAWAGATETTEEAAAETSETTVTETSAVTETFHPLFTNLSDGLVQLRKIMDENTLERESLRTEREMLLAETAAKSGEIDDLKATVSTQEDKIGGLQSALSVLMSQCDQQLQAIRTALGQA